MMEDLLPPQVVSVVIWGDDPSARLFPEEEAQLAKAIDSRVREIESEIADLNANTQHVDVEDVTDSHE